VVAPVVILALLGWVIRDQHAPPARLGIVNQAGTPGAAIADRLAAGAAAAGMTLVTLGDAAGAADEAIRAGRADLVVVLPTAFVLSPAGSPAPIEVVVPGISPGDDGARVGVLQRVVAGLLPGTGLTVAIRTVFGSGQEDALNAFAPALIGFFGFFFVFILTGVSFLRERIGGTLERLLATPVSRGEIVLGYSVGFAIFASIQMTIILVFALANLSFDVGGVRVAFGLGVPSAGTPVLAFLVAVLVAIGAVNLAIFLSTFARTELQILQFIPIVIVPQGLLGGVFWSVDSLPSVLQPLSRVMPLTYAIEGLRNVLVKGVGLENSGLQLDIVVLAGFAVFFVLIAGRTIRREVV
jgi:ABC-2 type transport system permease protein